MFPKKRWITRSGAARSPTKVKISGLARDFTRVIPAASSGACWNHATNSSSALWYTRFAIGEET